MFCRKCGKEIGAKDAFCPFCGSKTANSTSVAVSGFKFSEISGILDNSRIARLGAMKWHFLSGVVLLLVSALLAGREMISFEYDILYYGDSISVGLLEDYGFLRFVFRVAYFAAVICAIYPMIKNQEWERYHIIPSLVVSIIGVAVFCITLLSGIDVVGSAAEGWKDGVYHAAGTSSWDWVDVSIGLTGVGWVFLLSSVGSALVMFKVSKEIQAEQKQYQQKTAEETLCKASENGETTHIRCPRCGRVQKSVSSFCEECYEPLT